MTSEFLSSWPTLFLGFMSFCRSYTHALTINTINSLRFWSQAS